MPSHSPRDTQTAPHHVFTEPDVVLELRGIARRVLHASRDHALRTEIPPRRLAHALLDVAVAARAAVQVVDGLGM